MSKVRRSVYQKEVEENKSLKNDIAILVGTHNPTRLNLINKWRSKFKMKRL